MIDAILSSVRGVATTWKDDVVKRRKLSRLDPVADTLDYCASELLAQLEQINADTEWLSAEAWAAQLPRRDRPSIQTVRRWCRTGRLRAEVGEHGEYRIRRDARPAQRRARARRPA